MIAIREGRQGRPGRHDGGLLEVREDMRKHVDHRIATKDAIDMPVALDHGTAVERWIVALAQGVIRRLRTFGQEASIVRAVEKRDRHIHPIQMRQIDLRAVEGHDVTHSHHPGEMLEGLHTAHAKQLMQIVVKERREIRMVVQLRIEKTDPVAHRTTAVFVVPDRIETQGIVKDRLLPVVVSIGIGGQRVNAKRVDDLGQVKARLDFTQRRRLHMCGDLRQHHRTHSRQSTQQRHGEGGGAIAMGHDLNIARPRQATDMRDQRRMIESRDLIGIRR